MHAASAERAAAAERGEKGGEERVAARAAVLVREEDSRLAFSLSLAAPSLANPAERPHGLRQSTVRALAIDWIEAIRDGDEIVRSTSASS